MNPIRHEVPLGISRRRASRPRAAAGGGSRLAVQCLQETTPRPATGGLRATAGARGRSAAEPRAEHRDRGRHALGTASSARRTPAGAPRARSAAGHDPAQRRERRGDERVNCSSATATSDAQGEGRHRGPPGRRRRAGRHRDRAVAATARSSFGTARGGSKGWRPGSSRPRPRRRPSRRRRRWRGLPGSRACCGAVRSSSSSTARCWWSIWRRFRRAPARSPPPDSSCRRGRPRRPASGPAATARPPTGTTARRTRARSPTVRAG